MKSCGDCGQREEHAGVHPARNQIVPGAFGRALGQKRRFDIDETVVVEEAPHGLGDRVARDQHLLEARPPEVEVAVLEPEALGHVGLVLDHERQGLGRVQDRKVAHEHLDLAGRELGVHRVARPRSDLAGNGEHELAPDVVGQRVRVRGRFGIDDHLGDAGAVAEVDEDEPAVVAPGVHPAHERHGRAHVLFRAILRRYASFSVSSRCNSPFL